MVKYYFEGSTFVVEDYQHAKRFSSFLPAIAGKDGKPLWAFYASVGQCMGGFGVNNKETPITPFDSATLAYQNIPIKSFRTFLKIDGVNHALFEDDNNAIRTLKINKSNISIIEECDEYKVVITYSTVSHRNYAGLIRNVEIINKSKESHKYQICDGLPVFFPLGLSNFCYKEMVSLMGAYCEIDLNNNAPFVKFKTSTGDNSVVELAHNGNGFVSIDSNGKRLANVIELYQVFLDDSALIRPLGWLEKGAKILNEEQQTENHLPCAFSISEFSLKSQEKYGFSSLFGSFDNIEDFNSAIKEFDVNSSKKMIEETEELVNSYLPNGVKTSNPLFDDYIAQCVLDNNLRGGFPIILDDKNGGQPYYIFSRKHGDMERDYNAFNIPSTYFSSGPGNFRDVNQNRRSDLYFKNEIKDYNIKIFFSLIQMDGQNPLTVKPLVFKKNKDFDESLLKDVPIKDKLLELLTKGSQPGNIYTLLKDNHIKNADELFSDILNNSHQEISASFSEGYWIDHWTYNVDLLENYASVYPDKMEDLLFKDEYKYFHSLVYVNPRSEKYCLVNENKIRQYGTIDLASLKSENEKNGLKGDETLWKKDQNGKEIEVSLASKIFNLILVKFSTLDAHQMGIEMECEKPGWNDAMNGLPGLFASAMSETIELLRLVNFAIESFKPFEDKNIDLMDDQYDLFVSIKDGVKDLLSNKITSFEYWDKVTTSREILRKNTHISAKNSNKSISIKESLFLLEEMKEILSKGIFEAKKLGGGIIPSYIINDVTKYEITDKVNHLGYRIIKPLEFKQRLIPYFLEASARLAKLGDGFFNQKDYDLIYRSGLRDQKLGYYKTCDDIEDAPFEIGRVHAFTKGWLERECNFLHMCYKYLLGLLKAGLYDSFYKEMKVNFVYNMDPYVYGRSPIENSSFIVPTCNPNKRMHGQGQFARLTGANAEVLDMFFIMFLGEKAFSYENGTLRFIPSPKLSKEFFDKDNEVSYPLFSKCKVTIYNPRRIDLFNHNKYVYCVNGEKYNSIEGQLALDLRDGKIKELRMEVVDE
jgi:hypothetical protein